MDMMSMLTKGNSCGTGGCASTDLLTSLVRAVTPGGNEASRPPVKDPNWTNPRWHDKRWKYTTPGQGLVKAAPAIALPVGVIALAVTGVISAASAVPALFAIAGAGGLALMIYLNVQARREPVATPLDIAKVFGKKGISPRFADRVLNMEGLADALNQAGGISGFKPYVRNAILAFVDKYGVDELSGPEGQALVKTAA